MIERDIPVSVQPTPKELAREFCYMNIKECAEFFNEIGNVMYIKNKTHFDLIAQEIINSDDLTKEGRMVLNAFYQRRNKVDLEKDKWAYTE